MTRTEKILLLKEVSRAKILEGISLGMSIDQAKELAMREIAYLNNMHPRVIESILKRWKSGYIPDRQKLESLVDEIADEIKSEEHRKKSLLFRMREILGDLVEGIYLEGWNVGICDGLSFLVLITTIVICTYVENAHDCCLAMWFGSVVAVSLAQNMLIKIFFFGLFILTVISFSIILCMQL